jgi:uncharacterized membrane protein
LRVSRWLLALFFIAAGVNHFIRHEVYTPIVPPWLPWPEALVLLSGIAEVAGGVGLLFRATRRAAGLGLIALLVAVFPANVYAALHGMNLGSWQVPVWVLWLRLPLQAAMIGWVYVASVRRRSPNSL